MIDERVLLGEPLKFKNLYVKIPTVHDVFCKTGYSVYTKILTITQQELEEEFLGTDKKTELPKDFKVPTPFEHLLSTAYNSDEYHQLVLQAFKFYLDVDVTLLFNEKKILIGDINSKVSEINKVDELEFIFEEEFHELQNLIRLASGQELVDAFEESNPMIARMKAKARYRDKIKAKQQQRSGEAQHPSTLLMGLCFMEIGVTPFNIKDLPYAAISYYMQMYRNKQRFDLDIQSLLAGADKRKVHPKDWIRNIDD